MPTSIHEYMQGVKVDGAATGADQRADQDWEEDNFSSIGACRNPTSFLALIQLPGSTNVPLPEKAKTPLQDAVGTLLLLQRIGCLFSFRNLSMNARV